MEFALDKAIMLIGGKYRSKSDQLCSAPAIKSTRSGKKSGKKEQIKEKLKSLQQEEIKLAKKLEDKYGNGEISLETGEFLPSK